MKAYLKNAPIAPRKGQLVAKLVRGKNAVEASTMLGVMNKKGAQILKKLIDSALANAEHNFNKSTDGLVISHVNVLEGMKLRRHIPHSKGRAWTILHRYSHIVLELSDGMPSSSTK